MELLEKIKEDFPEIPVIMITGYATFKTSVQAVKLGAFDYIPKPFLPEEITAVTARALERLRITREEPEKMPSQKGRETHSSQPADLYVLPEHSWAKLEADDTVRIGVEDAFQLTLGPIASIDLPVVGAHMSQGKACARLTARDMHCHTLWSPVSGTIIDVNDELNKDSTLANREPYGRGWVALLRPDNLEKDLKNLIHYRLMS
jgi:glycine cleavage system H lipoate-binding protein